MCVCDGVCVCVCHVQADDGRSVATVRIVVEVVDANDNSPEFDSDDYDVSIVENNPSGVQYNMSDIICVICVDIL